MAKEMGLKPRPPSQVVNSIEGEPGARETQTRWYYESIIMGDSSMSYTKGFSL
jgi:hypothetical protein